MPNKHHRKLLFASLLALLACYFLAVFAFPNQIFVRIYVLAALGFSLACGYLLGSLRRDTQVWHLVNDLKLQIENKEFAQEKLTQADLRLKRQNEALAVLTAKHLTEWQNPEEVFRQISELSAQTLDVERMSFWLFSDDEQEMRCVDMYHRKTQQHSAGETLSVKALPKYFQALSKHRVVAANDVMTHEATAEFLGEYLKKSGIGALLGSAVWLNGNIAGVICYEHVGCSREWTLDEQNFAIIVADITGHAVESQERYAAETELVKYRHHLEEMVRLRTQALENSAKIFKFLFERAPVGILYMDCAANVIEMNPEAEKASGYSREYAVGRSFYELFSTKKTRGQHLRGLRRILAAEKYHSQEYLMRASDGSIYEYLISAGLEVNADGKPVIIGIGQDIGTQKVLEASLVAAREAAEGADRIKSMFLASMSHELRTPLNSIIGFLGIVLHEMSGPLNSTQRDQLSRAYYSAKHLLALISDVIDISKIEAGFLQAHIEGFEIKPLLQEAEQVLAHLVTEKKLKIDIKCDKSIVLETDRKRLLQVVLNVLSNAIKYTEKGSIAINALVQGSKLVLSVQDTGVGIATKDMNNLFKPFAQGQSDLRLKALGTGLGLYLTRIILTRLLSGTVRIKSKVGVGTTVTIKLPLKTPRKRSKNRAIALETSI